MIETVSGYVFTPEDLNVHSRLPGISAFMRIRNGQDFLEQTIRTHVHYFDEIVAVYNQCTDQTESILSRMASEFGSKIRVIHYTDRVHPPGSEGHAKTPGNSPNSLVNYYNFALAATRFRVATKLDDDHLGIGPAIETVHKAIASAKFNLEEFWGFSGLNLCRNEQGAIGIPGTDPISGNGDIRYFTVSHKTFFSHDRRFEKFNRGPASRKFIGWTYWHLKYLKSGLGFLNYELDQNPSSRYQAKLRKIRSTQLVFTSTCDFARLNQPTVKSLVCSWFSDKARFQKDRDSTLLRCCNDLIIPAELLGN